MSKKKLYTRVIEYFSETRPIAETELHYRTPYELLVAVILSAQCTDKRVNVITPDFFERFPNPEALSKAKVEDIFELIKSCSYPNNKAKNLSGMAKTLISDFNGVVPSDMDLLQKLPGVGRKTANVMLSVAFDKPAMAVDTHVFRVSHRLGLVSNATTPLAVEKQLVENFPEELLPKAHHWLILHGRYVCTARNPKCSECGLTDVCLYFSQQKSSKAD
ncbi:MAG TPA: endonuclease III [Tenuifilaceae bacterium]|nr:endonuclease III [Tenuifilaceae bacterium]